MGSQGKHDRSKFDCLGTSAEYERNRSSHGFYRGGFSTPGIRRAFIHFTSRDHFDRAGTAAESGADH
jgi:hypothetical protein